MYGINILSSLGIFMTLFYFIVFFDVMNTCNSTQLEDKNSHNDNDHVLLPIHVPSQK